MIVFFLGVDGVGVVDEELDRLDSGLSVERHVRIVENLSLLGDVGASVGLLGKIVRGKTLEGVGEDAAVESLLGRSTLDFHDVKTALDDVGEQELHLVGDQQNGLGRDARANFGLESSANANRRQRQFGHHLLDLQSVGIVDGIEQLL